MPAPADSAWGLLQDIEQVAACMPGARITERIDERHYKGTVGVRLGPASLSFRGEIELVKLEPSTRTLRFAGKGTDTTGGSGVSLDLTARVDAVDAASCQLVGRSEMTLNGRVATFGGRMADAVADQVLQQFAANFAAELKAQQSSPAGAAPAAAEGAAGVPAAAARASQLNALALLWGIVRSWLHSLFSRRGG